VDIEQGTEADDTAGMEEAGSIAAIQRETGADQVQCAYSLLVKPPN